MPNDRDLLGAVPISHPHDDVQPDGDAPGNDAPPVSPLLPGSMHRAEDDRTRAGDQSRVPQSPGQAPSTPRRRRPLTRARTAAAPA